MTEKFLPRQIECYLEAAETQADPAVCERAADPTVRFQCLSLYAERRSNPDACHRIEGTEVAETNLLQNACVVGVAIATRNAALCERVADPLLRDTCLLQLVLEGEADAALCERISEPAIRDACRQE